MSEFGYDLARSQPSVDRVLQIIKQDHPFAYKTEGKDERGDIYIEERDEYVEVKYDPASNSTHNYFIEIEMGGKLSSLLATQSPCWVFDDDHNLLFISTNNIKNCILLNRLTWVEMKNGGDWYSKKCYLIPKETLSAFGQILKYD